MRPGATPTSSRRRSSALDTTTFSLRTRAGFSCTDVTRQIGEWLTGKGDGLCNVFAPHATAGLALIETGSGTEADAETAIDRILPRDEALWTHSHGSPGHGADHVLPLLVSSSLTVPVIDGRLALGTWQSVVLVDPNRDNPDRTIRLSFLSG